MPRLRRILTTASAILALLLAALWLVSLFRYPHFAYAPATVVRNESIPVGAMGAWEFRQTNWTMTLPHRGLIVARSEFLSLNDTDADFSRFDRQRGFMVRVYSSGPFRIDRRFWYFRGPEGVGLLGFAHQKTGGPGNSARAFTIPFWFLIAIFATPPFLTLRRAQRTRRRLARGQCTRCAYQLDAAMTICPECGLAAVRSH